MSGITFLITLVFCIAIALILVLAFAPGGGW